VPLNQRDIDELKAIYLRTSGERLSNADAWEMGNRLVRLFDVLTRSPGAKSDILYPGSNRVPFDPSGPGAQG
jgi:hypothetical protein